MTKTSRDKEEHWHKVTSTVDLLADEYADWFGWPPDLSFGRYVALGEFILEATESDGHHDKWLMDARESFLKWKREHRIETAPPPDPKMGR